MLVPSYFFQDLLFIKWFCVFYMNENHLKPPIKGGTKTSYQ